MKPYIEELKERMDQLDELKTKRAEILFKQAREIGEIDNVINQAWNKISSLISVLNS